MITKGCAPFPGAKVFAIMEQFARCFGTLTGSQRVWADEGERRYLTTARHLVQEEDR
jgi:hypothetical protein